MPRATSAFFRLITMSITRPLLKREAAGKDTQSVSEGRRDLVATIKPLVRCTSPTSNELSSAANRIERAQVSGRDAEPSWQSTPNFPRQSRLFPTERAQYLSAHNAGEAEFRPSSSANSFSVAETEKSFFWDNAVPM